MVCIQICTIAYCKVTTYGNVVFTILTPKHVQLKVYFSVYIYTYVYTCI